MNQDQNSQWISKVAVSDSIRKFFIAEIIILFFSLIRDFDFDLQCSKIKTLNEQVRLLFLIQLENSLL